MWEWAEERHPLSNEHGYAADDEAVNEPRAQELPAVPVSKQIGTRPRGAGSTLVPTHAERDDA
jgi:hypothetical protein